MEQPEPGRRPEDQLIACGGFATIWQAEGVLMEQLEVGPQQAHQLLRWLARENGQALIDTSAAIIEGCARPD